MNFIYHVITQMTLSHRITAYYNVTDQCDRYFFQRYLPHRGCRYNSRAHVVCFLIKRDNTLVHCGEHFVSSYKNILFHHIKTLCSHMIEQSVSINGTKCFNLSNKLFCHIKRFVSYRETNRELHEKEIPQRI